MKAPHNRDNARPRAGLLFDLVRQNHWQWATGLALGVGVALAAVAELGMGWISTPSQRLVMVLGGLALAPLFFNMMDYSSDYDRPPVRFRVLGAIHPALATIRGTAVFCVLIATLMFLVALIFMR